MAGRGDPVTSRVLVAALIMVATLALSSMGCAPIPAYKRAMLMQRVVHSAECPLAVRFDAHVHQTREAMAGATGNGGPSCGCN